MTNSPVKSAVLGLLTVCVVGCGGGGNDQRPATRDPDPPIANRAPTIAGTPLTAVAWGRDYRFEPTASDPDGDVLTFLITNQPDWSSFDPVTGLLTGTPDETDIGTTIGIAISVSDGELSASLAPFNLEVRQLQLGSATVSWAIPSTNADGSALTDLAGFRVHYGTMSNDYSVVVEIDDPLADSVLIDELSPGTYFFAVTAVDRADNESAFSDEVSKVVQP